MTYKPHPDAYLLAPRVLDLRPEEVMLVAAHADDLRGGQAAGLRTALVMRPLEWGAEAPPPQTGEQVFDYLAQDFLDLATQLGA